MLFWRIPKTVSTSLREMTWHNTGKGMLAVKFQSGTTYTYEDVPLEVYHRLVEAGQDEDISLGSLFHHTVKAAGYAYTRVD